MKLGRKVKVNQKQNSENKFDVLKAGIAGGAIGYAAKRLLPLDAKTDARIFNDVALHNINIKALQERQKVLENLKELNHFDSLSQPAKDVFVKGKQILAEEIDPKKLHSALKENIASLGDENAKETISNFYETVTRAGKTKASQLAHEVKKAAKAERPAMYYVAIGALILMTAALVKTAVNKLFPKQEQQIEQEEPTDKKVFTMSDILLESFSTPCELMISEDLHRNRDDAE